MEGRCPRRPFEDPTVLRARLADYLSAQTGAAVTIESLVKFPAGFSWITYGVRLAGFPQAQNVILRIGPPYGLFAPYSAMPEFESLSALQSSAVPIPRAFLASDDASTSGRAVFPLRESRRRDAFTLGRAGRRLARGRAPGCDRT